MISEKCVVCDEVMVDLPTKTKRVCLRCELRKPAEEATRAVLSTFLGKEVVLCHKVESGDYKAIGGLFQMSHGFNTLPWVLTCSGPHYREVILFATTMVSKAGVRIDEGGNLERFVTLG